MFYEIKEKRVETSSQVKWWLTAAFSAVIITATFVGIILWLGTAIRQQEPAFVDRQTAFRDYQQYKPSRPTITTPPPLEYPTAEILKTTIKNKKGRIEIVEMNNSGEKPSIRHLVSTLGPKITTTNAETNAEDAESSLEIEIEEDIDTYPVEHQQPDVQLRAKISKLASVQKEYNAAEKLHLQDDISPLEESSVQSSSENNSVKKKSEAVLPSWYDPSLQNNQPKSDPSNHLKQDGVYDIPNFSHIKPDLSAFNTKTIPAFTYLKDPLPQLENLPDPSSEEGESQDDTYYYQPTTNSQFSPIPPFKYKKSEQSFMSFLQKRLHNFQDWLLYGSKKNRTVDLLDVFKAVNNSFHTKNIGNLFMKFKDFYSTFNTTNFQNSAVSNLLYPTTPSILHNSTNLVSFGLLAIDLFLLHNVQQIVWNEEAKIGEEMLKDPDVLALNALFMSPDRIQQLRQTNSRILTDREKKGVVHDLIEFINGGLRAVLNLSKAYKSSTSKSNARSTNTSNGSTLDCIWTLYCRNLDKTAKLHGPYGFLAKMNR